MTLYLNMICFHNLVSDLVSVVTDTLQEKRQLQQQLKQQVTILIQKYSCVFEGSSGLHAGDRVNTDQGQEASQGTRATETKGTYH